MQPTSRVVSRGDLRLVCFCSPALSTPPARRPPLAPVNPLPSHSHSRRGGSAAKERCRGHVHMYVHVPRPTGSRQTPCAYACRVLSSRRLPPSNSPRCGRDARMRRSRHWAASQLEPQAAWARHDVAAVARMSCNHGARARARRRPATGLVQQASEGTPVPRSQTGRAATFVTCQHESGHTYIHQLVHRPLAFRAQPQGTGAPANTYYILGNTVL